MFNGKSLSGTTRLTGGFLDTKKTVPYSTVFAFYHSTYWLILSSVWIPVYEDNGVFLHGISIAVGVIIVCGEILAPLVLTQQNHPAVSVDIGFFTGIVLRKDTFFRLKRALSYRNIPYAKRIPDIFRGNRISVF